MICTILTPVDGSVHAQMALDLSTDLAVKYDAQIVVLHVVTHDNYVPREHYLAPTDSSDQADKAVDLACDIAARYGAKLSIVYVASCGPSLETLRNSIDMEQLSESARGELDTAQHPIAEHVSSRLIPPVVANTALKEIGERVLERARKTALAKGVLSTNTLLLAGAPARKILQVARRECVDLITMGSRGLGGAEGLLAGGVSYKVNHKALCNCLFVR